MNTPVCTENIPFPLAVPKRGPVKAAVKIVIKISGEPDEVMTMGMVHDIANLIADERGLAIGLLVLIALLVAVSFLKSE